MGLVQMDPIGFWIYAREFRRAADVLPHKSAFSPVAYYLHCHSIELSLKAFLLRRGISLRVLRNRPLGHDLIALLRRANRLGLREIVRVTPAQQRELVRANEYYAGKAFEYFQFRRFAARYHGLPEGRLLDRLSARLVNRLEHFCLSDPDE